MILFDVAPSSNLVGLLAMGVGVIIFFFLIFAAIVFVGYKLLRRRKDL
jgi:hypothetical protein